MKTRRYFSGIIAVLFLYTANLFAANLTTAKADSTVNLMIEFSLFHEDHKNSLYKSALPHGWNVVHYGPEKFVKYRLFPAMEDILIFMHDSVATTPDEKMAFTDTLLYLYEKALEFDPKRESRWLLKKAYVLEQWKDAPVEEVTAAYDYAFEKYPDTKEFYYHRYAIYLTDKQTEENGFKLKAMQIYQKLADRNPDDPKWNEYMQGLAADQDELIEILKKAWDMDKENPEKAYTYASLCLKAEKYELALEALEFLVAKSPDVINYWQQLSKAYEKLQQTDKAINAYKTLTELQPDNSGNFVNLAIIYKNQGQLAVARSYLYKASQADPNDAYPYYLEGNLYEQAARDCGFEFEDRIVYLLAYQTYAKAARRSGPYAQVAADRTNALKASVPTDEDYFFRKIKSGDELKIEGKCYGWIKKSVIVP